MYLWICVCRIDSEVDDILCNRGRFLYWTDSLWWGNDGSLFFQEPILKLHIIWWSSCICGNGLETKINMMGKWWSEMLQINPESQDQNLLWPSSTRTERGLNLSSRTLSQIYSLLHSHSFNSTTTAIPQNATFSPIRSLSCNRTTIQLFTGLSYPFPFFVQCNIQQCSTTELITISTSGNGMKLSPGACTGYEKYQWKYICVLNISRNSKK